MATYKTRRILPIVLTIVIIIVAIAGIVGLVRLIVTGGTGSPKPASEDVSIIEQHLLSTIATRSVRMTVRGPIVADEDFRSYQITVSPSSRQFQTFTGYLDTLTRQETLANNTAAYSQFVYALDKANMAAGRQFTDDRNDVRGICATGKVYEFATLNDDKVDSMLWTSTCGGSPGSLKASVAQLSRLFLNQVPRSSNIIDSLSL